MIVAQKDRRRAEFSLQARRIPTLSERRNILRLDQLVLHPLSEHPRLAPAPHFLPALILHDEIVRLSIREPKLHHLRGVVLHIELELDNTTRVHSEPRRQRNLRMSLSSRCRQG